MHFLTSLIKLNVWFPWWLSGKESAYNVGDLGSVPESGRSFGEGNDYPLQNSCLENPMDRGTWQATLFTLAKAFPWTRSRLRTWGLGERTKGLKDCSGFPRVLPAQEVCSCLRAFAHALSYLGHPSQGTHKTCSFLSFKSFLKCWLLNTDQYALHWSPL